jgi:CRISPR system Cascade subunit CasD
METLVFQLHGPLSSWGEPAVGEFRGTAEWASSSALIGLLGAALGLLREDELAHAALRDGLCFAVGVLSGGSLLRDYHTAQVPPRSAMKGRPHATRRHELLVPKADLSTILSTRDHRQNAACLVAVQMRTPSQAPALPELAAALREPKFLLYLGRKACVPAAPMWPQLIAADSAHAAFGIYRERFESARSAAADSRGRAPLEPLPPLTRVAFDDHVNSGLKGDISTTRKDRLIRRKGWQFGDRVEHVALLEVPA